jgi:hypothetical protein
MTTTPKTLYRAGDQLALKIEPQRACCVDRNQQPRDKHVWVWFPNAIAPIGIREEDLVVYGGVSCSNE